MVRDDSSAMQVWWRTAASTLLSAIRHGSGITREYEAFLAQSLSVIGFCVSAVLTSVVCAAGLASPKGPAMLHVRQIDVPSQRSHEAAREKLAGLASGTVSSPDTRTIASGSARLLGPADHVTWCPGSAWQQ